MSMTLEDRAALVTFLQNFDTPTVCNAIEMAQGRRGFDCFTHKTMFWTGKDEQRLVGFAATAKIASARQPDMPQKHIREMRSKYFRYMDQSPGPVLVVIEDEDGKGSKGAWWGEINTQVHKSVFGHNGAITNGLIRDLNDLPADFSLLAGGIGPSHGFVHITSIDTPVEIFGMRVKPGDLIHADRHGAVCIPNEVTPTIGLAVQKLISAERIVLDPIKKGPISFEEFELLWQSFEAART